MYPYTYSDGFKRILKKLFKKDKEVYEQILNKVNEIVNSPNIEHYKNLKYGMKMLKRVHIGSFVLVFSFNKSKNLISFEDYDHHNIIYR